MKALFIGGTGTISTEVTKLFVKQGGELCVLNRGNHNGDLPQGVQVLIGDIHDEGSIQTLLLDRRLMWSLILSLLQRKR